MKAQQDQLVIYNSLKGEKEPFVPLVEGNIGMYVCGPTLYSEPHMGNMRTFINFDLIYRYLLHLGFRVKYVRNITDAIFHRKITIVLFISCFYSDLYGNSWCFQNEFPRREPQIYVA